MDFKFTEEQEAFRQTIRKFVERETSRELDRQLEEEGRFPFELVDKMAETGLLGLPFPEEYGGVGGSVMDFVIAEASEPASGSVRAKAPRSFPFAIWGRYSFFCSSLPFK